MHRLKLILDAFVQRHSRAVKPMNKWVDDVQGPNGLIIKILKMHILQPIT